MENSVENGQEEAGLQMAAEEGFTKNLQRQLIRARTQLQAVEAKYQEKVQENQHTVAAMKQKLTEALSQVELLNKEKETLRQKQDSEEHEKEKALQTVKDLTEKCDNLQLEKEKIMKEGAILHGSLRKAHQELAILREKQEEGMASEDSPELLAEVAHMRDVIHSLKQMVLEQRKQLGNCDMARSLSSRVGGSMHELGSVRSDPCMVGAAHAAGSPSGQSWEVVNATLPSSLDARRQQEQQQRQQLLAMQQRCVTSSSSVAKPNWAPHNVAANTSLTKPPAMKGMAPQDKGTGTGAGVTPKLWASQSAVMQRQADQVPALPPKSRTEVLRSVTRPVFKPPDFTDGSYVQPHVLGEVRASQHSALGPAGSYIQPHVLGEGRASQHFALGPALLYETAAGRNYVGAGSEPVQGMTTQPGQLSAEAPAVPAVYSQQPQFTVLQDPSNLHNVAAYGNGTTAPSMHILNPGVMAGARVIRNNSDSFGSAGSVIHNTLTGLSSPPHSGRPVPSALPHEHDQGPLMNNAAMAELSPVDDTNLTNAPVLKQAVSGLDRKCPVCGRDFSHISMDEFQSHVFECFDNAEDNSIAPDTLQPETVHPSEVEATERICPVCDKTIPADKSQQFFEGHVQSHFEEITEQFEVLDVKEP